MLSLFPPNHPILVSLSSPLPPTSSPLHSTLSLLKELLTALRQRCAPVRDETVDNLLASFEQPSSPLPQFVIDMIKAIIALADQMKSDLNTFIIGSMTDSQLRDLLSNDVKSRERDLVPKIWGTKDLVRHSWHVWLDNSLGAPNENRWVSRLIQALFSDKPVSCKLPTSTPLETARAFAQHELPPQLFFSAPLLIDLQNYLQAIVIAAALRSLVRLPSFHPNPDFMTRIWTLLKSEINTSGNSKYYDDTERTKIINLADEVVRATQLSFTSGKLDINEEQTLRSSVERTLRPNDPVYLLLKKRLRGSLEKLWLSDGSTATQRSSTSIPEKMLTGRSSQDTSISDKRLKLMVSESLSDCYPSSSSHQNMVVTEAERMVIPGFEDVVLRKAIAENAEKLANCIEWLGSVWGDLV
jgi:T-complex protein 11